MTSSNGNIFRVTGHLCGKFIGPRWILRTKGQWRGALIFSLICVWLNGWVNNHEVGDLRRYRAHYDVTAMENPYTGKLVSSNGSSFTVQKTASFWINRLCIWLNGRLQYRHCQRTNDTEVFVLSQRYHVLVIFHRTQMSSSSSRTSQLVRDA